MMSARWSKPVPSPRVFESVITPRTNLRFVPGIFALRGSLYHSLQAAAAVVQRKLLPQFSLAAPLSNAVGTAAAGKPVAK